MPFRTSDGVVAGLEALTHLATQTIGTSESSACIPVWLAGAVVAPLATAVVYQTRRVVQLTDLAIELAKRQHEHSCERVS